MIGRVSERRPRRHLAAALVGGAVFLSLGAAPGARAQVIAIRDAEVHAGPGQVLERATVVISGGVVRGVAKDLAIPAGAQVIEGKGKVVTAGLIAAQTSLGLVEISLEDTARRGSFGDGGATPVHAAYDVRDSYNPMSVAIPVARAQGVTAAVVPPAGGLLAGTSAAFALAGERADQALIAGPAAMYASVGLGSIGLGGEGGGDAGWLALSRLREVLDDARAYARDKRGYERNQARAMAASRLDLDALQPVLQGRVPLVVAADRASDILAVLRLAKDFGLRVVIAGGAEAWAVAEDLAKANAGVIIDPTQNLPDSFDSVRVRDDSAGVLAAAGVTVAISPLGGAHGVGGLRQLAGIAVANGMRPADALAAVTTAPARLFGLDRGTIAAGKAADLVVWSGDPFELSTRAEHVIIGGVERDLRTRQTSLFERYRDLSKAPPAPLAP